MQILGKQVRYLYDWDKTDGRFEQNFYGALYGPPPMHDLLWSVIWGSLSQIKGAKHYFEGEFSHIQGIDRADGFHLQTTYPHRPSCILEQRHWLAFQIFLNWIGSAISRTVPIASSAQSAQSPGKIHSSNTTS
jgi:hypothetical protein